MPRKRHVSRNGSDTVQEALNTVMPRKRHVSRNFPNCPPYTDTRVMPRKRHVSRNGTWEDDGEYTRFKSCLARGM